MSPETRSHYQGGELERLEASALDGVNMVNAALERTLEAIEHQDVELAQLVVTDDGPASTVATSRSTRA